MRARAAGSEVRSRYRRGLPASVSGGGSVWVASLDSGSVARIDPRTAEVVGEPIAIEGQPLTVAAEGNAVWILDQSGTVVRIDPEDGAPTGDPVVVGGRPTGLAMRDGAVWVANRDLRSVARIETGK